MATIGGLISGSVLFAGPGGLISEDTTNLTWDDAANILSASTINVAGTITATRLLIGA